MSEPFATLRPTPGDTEAPLEQPEHLDVLIVGAGLSGIDAAYHLQTSCPGKTYAIFEARDAVGGTWDLFRYPGVRSDSDMHTLGFPFRPWKGDHTIVDGASIRDYIRETSAHYGIDRNIRFGHRVVHAAWSTAQARWTINMRIEGAANLVQITCNFLYMCSGYYDYEGGFSPVFPGLSYFQGRLIHPQKWPENLDYAGKRIVVIGSGATAVTLVPALSQTAAHVTMLQRSPTYVVSRPAKDAQTIWMFRHLPYRVAAKFARWKNVLIAMTTFTIARRSPEKAKRMILHGVRQQLGPDYEVDRHFSPRYNPWDQRLCLVPDGDLFTALRSGRAEIVTDEIETLTETGIRLVSGAEIPADIIVSATGLVIRLMGGAEIDVDGVPVKASEKMLYKGAMFSDVPNLAFSFGYTNASWTLRCDLTARFVCRLLNYMDRKNVPICVPHLSDPSVVPEPLLAFSSGYVHRASGTLPRQGSKTPWRVHQNYILDLAAFAFGSVNDGTMAFHKKPESAAHVPQ
jgi:monooxygenase